MTCGRVGRVDAGEGRVELRDIPHELQLRAVGRHSAALARREAWQQDAKVQKISLVALVDLGEGRRVDAEGGRVQLGDRMLGEVGHTREQPRLQQRVDRQRADGAGEREALERCVRHNGDCGHGDDRQQEEEGEAAACAKGEAEAGARRRLAAARRPLEPEEEAAREEGQRELDDRARAGGNLDHPLRRHEQRRQLR
eukprot:2785360-Prymnesium_polylepis.1